eukprot:SAG22_NODE_3180_length_1873_cov_1.251973_2_plen_91_part_00
MQAQDTTGGCGADSLAAEVQRVMDRCCPPPPPLEAGVEPQPNQCSLPSTPTAACAAVFLPFFASCYGLLETQPNLPISQCECVSSCGSRA